MRELAPSEAARMQSIVATIGGLFAQLESTPQIERDAIEEQLQNAVRDDRATAPDHFALATAHEILDGKAEAAIADFSRKAAPFYFSADRLADAAQKSDLAVALRHERTELQHLDRVERARRVAALFSEFLEANPAVAAAGKAFAANHSKTLSPAESNHRPSAGENATAGQLDARMARAESNNASARQRQSVRKTPTTPT